MLLLRSLFLIGDWPADGLLSAGTPSLLALMIWLLNCILWAFFAMSFGVGDRQRRDVERRCCRFAKWMRWWSNMTNSRICCSVFTLSAWYSVWRRIRLLLCVALPLLCSLLHKKQWRNHFNLLLTVENFVIYIRKKYHETNLWVAHSPIRPQAWCALSRIMMKLGTYNGKHRNELGEELGMTFCNGECLNGSYS